MVGATSKGRPMPAGDKIHKGDKREAILRAALELIAEHGLQHTPMSLISKRSGASAGIIYHYFESKDDLLASLYYRVKGNMSRALMVADDAQQPLARRFQSLWLSIYRYCLAHPQEMIFLEQYESMPCSKQQDAELQDKTKTLYDLVEDKRRKDLLKGEIPPEEQALYNLVADLRHQDLLKDLPHEVVSEFTIGVALRLARQVAAGLISLDEAALNDIARACWDAIAR
jgi:AcrR family transcriptional regulator